MSLSAQLRPEFPILDRQIYNHPLIYFDNAATTQKPKAVIDTLTHYYYEENSNVHRGIHYLAGRATERLEKARSSVQSFLNAKKSCEIIFTKGATEAINLVAESWGRSQLRPGDEVLVSAMEHHANLVPWQQICKSQGATLRIIPLESKGEHLDLKAYEKMLSSRTKMVALQQVSNALGRIHPIAKMIKQAQAKDAVVLIDGAQAVPHIPTDVQALGADFYTFSAHKTYGPMGVGVLYGKEELLKAMPPYQSGGEMIKEVKFSESSFNELPYKFEAGTPNVAGVIGLEAALNWLQSISYKALQKHEEELLNQCTELLLQLPGLRLFAKKGEKVPICSFIVEGLHTFDIGQLLDTQGIALRTGHHCAQPLMSCLGTEGTVRASFAAYNNKEEVTQFVHALHKTLKKMR